MNFSPASTSSLFVFLAIVAGIIAAFLAAVHHAYRRDPQSRMTLAVAAGLAAWLGILAWLVASERLQTLPLSGLPAFFGSILVMSALTGFSSLGGRLVAAVPLSVLVGFQSFRLPLELVLHAWAAGGTIPTAMTWTGRNWDIVSGIVALLACPFAKKNRAVAWFANLVGLGLLLNVMRVALLSAPVPFGWRLERPLLVAFHLPYALIGPVCVGGALLGHIVLTRALLRRETPVPAIPRVT